MTGDQAARDAYYDTFSARYDDPRGGGYHRLIDDLELAALRPLATGARCLEVGCGTGLLLERLAAEATEAVGVDPSPGMRARALARGLDARPGTATELPFGDDRFDLVYAMKVLAHVPELGRALDEMARVTAPGGRVVFELYNPLSLRYAAKRLAGPGIIGEEDGRRVTEADIFTRWDPPWVIPRVLPAGLVLEAVHGVRVLTPAAFAHRVPGLGDLLRRAEHRARRSPLRWFGGFLVAVARKR